MQKKKPFNLRATVFVCQALCFGILSAYCFSFGKVFYGVLSSALFLTSCVILFLLRFTEFNIKSKVLLCLLMITVFTFGCCIFTHTVNEFDNASLGNHYFTVNAKVIEVQDSDNGKRLLIDDINVKGVVNGKLKYKAYVYVSGKSSVDLGNTIKFSSTLIDKSSVYENRFAVYDVLRSVKYIANVTADQITVTGNCPTVFERVNLFIRKTLDAGLEGEEFAVGYALLTGNGEYMNTETLSSYRMAGVAHIFAVSGLHIGFLATAISFIFDKFKSNKLVKAIVVTFLTLFYSGVCGFTASSIRAVIMCAVGLFASVGGERYDGLSSVTISGTAVLILQPLQIFSAGFQLSFGVVLGMILLAKPIAKLFKFLPEKLSSAIGAVLSAFLSSLPICLHAFGYVSPVSILANLIFIPAVSVIFTVLLVSTIIGGLFSIEIIALFIPNYVLKFVNMCIKAFDFESFIVSGVTLGAFSIFYYIALIIPSEYINVGKLTKIITTLVCVTVCVIGSVSLTIKDNNTYKIHVVGSEYLSTTLIETPFQTTLIVSDFSNYSSMGRLQRIADANGIENIDTVVVFNESFETAQEFLTKLVTVFNVKRICYYGQENAPIENVIEKSFGIASFNFTDSQSMSELNIDACYALNGKAITLNVMGNKIAVFKSDETFNYAGLTEKFDYVICGINADATLSFYNAKVGISYRVCNEFYDAESSGTLVFALN